MAAGPASRCELPDSGCGPGPVPIGPSNPKREMSLQAVQDDWLGRFPDQNNTSRRDALCGAYARPASRSANQVSSTPQSLLSSALLPLRVREYLRIARRTSIHSFPAYLSWRAASETAPLLLRCPEDLMLQIHNASIATSSPPLSARTAS
jgi:hypothetical protein